MLRVCALLLVSCGLLAADRWVEFRSGPFEVVTDAGERAGRDQLDKLEQFRYAVEQVLGATDLRSLWPIRILVWRKAATTPPALARDAFTGAVAAEGPLPREFQRECARILIDSAPGGLPPDVVSGLADLFSTLQQKGSQILLGAPLPAAQRNRNWAKMHMLTVPDDYFGKLRVMVYNLQHGVAAEPAYRNAFGKSPAAIDKEADAYFRAGNFATTQLRHKPIDPQEEFVPKPVDAGRLAVLRADLLLADAAKGREARSAYEAILKSSPGSPEALEGLGLLALREKQPDQARTYLAKAFQASSANARALLEYGRLETDSAQAAAAFQKAAKLNPRWAAPYVEMAAREEDAGKREQLLDAAAKLTPSPEERQRLWVIRAEAEARRKAEEEAEKKRQAEEKQREIEEAKQRSVASIQAALDKANREHPAIPPSSGKVVPWWDSPQPDAKVQGVLREVDCLGKQARLVIEGDDKKLTRLLVAAPNQLVIAGGGEKTFGCGRQKPARRVVVEYFRKPDAKLGTAGEAAVLEFP